MITDNHQVAALVVRHIDQEIEKLKDQLANPKPSDQYTDNLRLWSCVGEIRGLKKLKDQLTGKDAQ